MENAFDLLLRDALGANGGRAIVPATASAHEAATGRGLRLPPMAAPLALLDGPEWAGPRPDAARPADRRGWPVPDGWAGAVYAGPGTDLDEAVRSLAVGGLLVWVGGPAAPAWPDGVEVTPVEPSGDGPPAWRRLGEIMPGSRGCVVCGSHNPIGLGLRFWRSGDRVFARARPPAHFEGFDGVLHGGMVAALLDDALWYAVHAATGMVGMTVDLQVRFRKPARIGEDLTAAGRFAARRRSVAEASARLFGPDGEVLAEASGRFMPGREPLLRDGPGASA